jgi:hypothetical protein
MQNSYPPDKDQHLQSLWQDVRNKITNDRRGIEHACAAIGSNRRTITFLKERIRVNTVALQRLGEIKG